MKPADILQRLVDVHREKTALLRRHLAAARIAGQYDVNNTYQYVIAREDQHLGWLADAIRGLGQSVPEVQEPETLAAVKGDEAFRAVVGEDARAIEAFVDTWRPRTAGITNARHQRMLDLMLGEMQEQARLFRQASAGRVDLLGRRTGGDRTPGSVLSTRWVE